MPENTNAPGGCPGRGTTGSDDSVARERNELDGLLVDVDTGLSASQWAINQVGEDDVLLALAQARLIVLRARHRLLRFGA